MSTLANVIIIIIALLLIYFVYLNRMGNSELFKDPYVGNMVPYLINSGPSFDEPNQFGSVTDAYYCEHENSEKALWDQTHEIQLDTPL